MDKPTRVLVADDELNAVILLRRIMEREGFVVDDTRDGESALERAAENDYDLILLDVMMPGMDGFEVVEKLRQNPRTARVPVIFITARAKEPTDVERGLGIGADDYVRKPFNPRELAARAHSKIRAYHLEENLKRRTSELETLVGFGGRLNESLEVDALLQTVLTETAAAVAAHNAALLVYDADGALRRFRFLRFPEPATDPAALAQELAAHFQQAPDDGWAGDESPLAPIMTPYGYRSVLWTTLYHHGGRLGTLALACDEPGAYNEDHLRLLKSIGEQAALAVRNAELYGELRNYAENLEAMVEERTAALQTAQEELVRSEKMASLGRLSASIAHEVNNPLQAIRNCLELAIEDIEADYDVDKEMLQVAEQHVRRIRDITTRLLTFSRNSSDERGAVDVNDLLGEIFTLTRKQMENAGVALEPALGPLPTIEATADQLRQVFLNLTLNAIEAMPEGGTLRVVSAEENGCVVVTFADTGVGIASENLSRLFEPFFSTKHEGTGLGLSVSYGIIEAHGGAIEVASEFGQGATFRVRLPIRTPGGQEAC
ncbi:MAG: response regulator [Anaerolineae bacterium]|nr:response regulator [Anaerolineae bacterium]